jgi:hypothetical protein
MAFDVFISYSTKDKATADAACAALESAGIRCWIAPRDVIRLLLTQLRHQPPYFAAMHNRVRRNDVLG